MAKIIAIGAILITIYLLFFRKKAEKGAPSDSLDMVECATCGILVAQSEAISRGGAYFCSTKCLDKV